MEERSALMPKLYTQDQLEEMKRKTWERLSTDVERATEFAAMIIVKCSTCESSAHLAPLEQFDLRAGLDYAKADYRCSSGHITENVPLSELARVAITTIYKAKPALAEVEEVEVGNCL